MQADKRKGIFFGKKKPDLSQEKYSEKIKEEEIPLPSKSEILRAEYKERGKGLKTKDINSDRHIPVIERAAKSFSIKDIIAEGSPEENNPAGKSELHYEKTSPGIKTAFSPEAFENSWQEFITLLNGEGPRIISMFKSIKPEIENDQTIRIHLSNATQRDTFLENYRNRLMAFLKNKFLLDDIEIETSVDLTETNQKLYSDEQKYNYLVNKYPMLKEMKKNFNLDIT